MSKILKDYWRTTARAPRAYPGAKSYDIGLDVLGAMPAIRRSATPSPLTTVVKKAASTVLRTSPLAATTNLAKAVTQSVAKTAPTPVKPATGAPRPSQVNAAKTSLNLAKQMTTRRFGSTGANLTTKANRVLQRAASAAAHRVMGVVVRPTDDSGIDTNVLTAVEQAVDVGTLLDVELSALEQGMTLQQAVSAEAHQAHRILGDASYTIQQAYSDGVNLFNRAVAVINSYDPGSPDQSILQTVSQLKSDTMGWRSNVSQLVASNPNATLPTGTTTRAGTPSTTSSTSSSTTTPTISSITDSSTGMYNGGTAGDTVSIVGTNFTGVTAVLFSGMPAQFAVLSPTQINAVIPPSATTGTVQVVTPSGTASTSTPFNIMAASPPSYGTYGGGGGGYSGGGGGYDDSGDSGGGGYDDSGSYGDGGAGGYYEPGSAAADALQKFRQSGGTYDPFEDDGSGGGGDAGDGSTDDGSYASAVSDEDSDMDTGESEAVQAFRESGGTWDPFDDEGGA